MVTTASTFSSGTIRRWIHVTSRMISSSTTAIAEARPNLWNLNAMLTVWMTNVSLPFAPPVMMNGISKTDSEPEMARMNDSPTTGRMPGRMMYRNWCHRLAPSISAAS